MAYFYLHSPHPHIGGYQQVRSKRGNLQYLPDALHRSLILDAAPVQPIFRTRTPRPQRVHIAILSDDSGRIGPGTPCRPVRLVVGKLANSTGGAKKFLRSIIGSGKHAEPESPISPTERPLSWVSTRQSDKLLLRRRPRSGVWGAKEEGRHSVPEMRPAIRQSIAGPLGVNSRSSLSQSQSSLSNASVISEEQAPGISQLRIPEEKPLASGNGISVSIALAEPVLFLQGFEHGDLQANRSTAMLRGSLHLKVQKPTKIKAVSLRFRGQANTKWPEGIPPKKTELEELLVIMNHTWPFFNAQFPNAEAGTGADHVELQRSPQDIVNAKNRSQLHSASWNPSSISSQSLSSREARRLSLQVTQSRSFGKGESSTNGPSVSQRGYRTFQPGDYIYNFELPIDSHLPETIDVELGCVKYELEATIERAGAFKSNLVGSKEVMVIRTPAEGSLEQVEPIAISRNWEDQLHYDIVISGKSFPLGAQIPIAFKLTPLAKVQCHRVKVFVTESVEYYCNNKRVHRMEPTRKVQLFEKRADSPPTSMFPGSTMRITSGGGIPWDMREAAAAGQNVPPPDPTNLLGPLQSDKNIGPLEMEFNVQLPSCQMMRDREKGLKLHFDTTYSNIQVHHWIKIVMRLSKPDAADPTRRRHFEISIDSPFHILSCRATQANTSLPAYSEPETADGAQHLYECGCPGAAIRRNSPTSYVPTLNNLNINNAGPQHPGSSAPTPQRNGSTDSAGLTRPAAAHVSGPTNPSLARPIHIIRAPSFNPPGFEDEDPPPPLETPPPLYDTIASPTSGLADYFQRLSDAYQDDSDGDDEPGQRTPTGRMRVEVPLTPGARAASRSMDAPRGWAPLAAGVVPSGALAGPLVLPRRDTAAGAVSTTTAEPGAAIDAARINSMHTAGGGGMNGTLIRPIMNRT